MQRRVNKKKANNMRAPHRTFAKFNIIFFSNINKKLSELYYCLYYFCVYIEK